ncbi:hypothetical protein BESB_026260 [Besnoitia besnoiti]|uniref:Uncharacterized protein n=1 Tax=Besnoitia besnoiti TaxID=94643 RepID=A0A2A9M8D7_BESBE|nr:uncharacterized protein BESB_026260 [Besnoitia besnoiti]PFH31652.1 hypothetical protein BESB_026260 [Besnoitia besnoiti]
MDGGPHPRRQIEAPSPRRRATPGARETAQRDGAAKGGCLKGMNVRERVEGAERPFKLERACPGEAADRRAWRSEVSSPAGPSHAISRQAYNRRDPGAALAETAARRSRQAGSSPPPRRAARQKQEEGNKNALEGLS